MHQRQIEKLPGRFIDSHIPRLLDRRFCSSDCDFICCKCQACSAKHITRKLIGQIIYANAPVGYVSQRLNEPSFNCCQAGSNKLRTSASNFSEESYHPSGPTSSTQNRKTSFGSMTTTPLCKINLQNRYISFYSKRKHFFTIYCQKVAN